MDRTPGKLHKTNRSGYPGVSWHKGAGKWTARIRIDGKYRHLGLFDSPEDAAAIYQRAADERQQVKTANEERERRSLLPAVRRSYEAHGIEALTASFLKRAYLYSRLLKAGFPQPALLSALGLTEEFSAWKDSARKYRGEVKPKWSWEVAVATAIELREREGDLPTVEWCRKNGFSSLTNTVHQSGRTWGDLRQAVGCKSPGAGFYESRNGMRWRSRPEASLSNFLYARGVDHKRGERYADDYAEQSGRRWGRLDLHFLAKDGEWVDVEVWGDPLNQLSGGRYQITRAHKERYQANNSRFLGIPYKSCLSDKQLTKILEPYIGIIEPFQFDKPTDRIIQTSHWSDADELLIACKEFADQMNGGIFPSEDWLRKRGKYATRPGPPYNTLAVRVNQWLGGTRAVRILLGHGHVSTTAWTGETVIAAWREFQRQHGMTPSQARSASGKRKVTREVVTEASKIYEVARRHGVLSEAREGIDARKRVWSPERVIAAWRSFEQEHGLTPTQCMSAVRRMTLAPSVVSEAIRIYGAARYLGVLAAVRNRQPNARS